MPLSYQPINIETFQICNFFENLQPDVRCLYMSLCRTGDTAIEGFGLDTKADVRKKDNVRKDLFRCYWFVQHRIFTL